MFQEYNVHGRAYKIHIFKFVLLLPTRYFIVERIMFTLAIKIIFNCARQTADRKIKQSLETKHDNRIITNDFVFFFYNITVSYYNNITI